MKFIVGLGNIGVKYQTTRHNIGFMAVDALAKHYDVAFKPSKWFAEIAEFMLDGEKVVLIKPTTYMNDSGKAVHAILTYYGGRIDELLVLVDDMDMKLGKLRFRAQGSAGGHNGIKSIISFVKTQDFLRLKFGIGHPEHQKDAVVNFVLGKFEASEQIAVNHMLDRAIEAQRLFIIGTSPSSLANQING